MFYQCYMRGRNRLCARLGGIASAMRDTPLSGHVEAARIASGAFMELLGNSRWIARAGAKGICDFTAGNPQDMALPAYVDAIREASIPKSPSWFAYKGSEAPAREAAAAGLRERLGIPFQDDDIFLTKGASPRSPSRWRRWFVRVTKSSSRAHRGSSTSR